MSEALPSLTFTTPNGRLLTVCEITIKPAYSGVLKRSRGGASRPLWTRLRQQASSSAGRLVLHSEKPEPLPPWQIQVRLESSPVKDLDAFGSTLEVLFWLHSVTPQLTLQEIVEAALSQMDYELWAVDFDV